MSQHCVQRWLVGAFKGTSCPCSQHSLARTLRLKLKKFPRRLFTPQSPIFISMTVIAAHGASLAARAAGRWRTPSCLKTHFRHEKKNKPIPWRTRQNSRRVWLLPIQALTRQLLRLPSSLVTGRPPTDADQGGKQQDRGGRRMGVGGGHGARRELGEDRCAQGGGG